MGFSCIIIIYLSYVIAYMQIDTLLTQKNAHTEYKWGQNIWKEHMVKVNKDGTLF